MNATWRRCGWAAWVVLATMSLAAVVRADEPKAAIKGERVFSSGHSFHYFVPPILTDIASKAGVEQHRAVGLSALGGSRVIQHWKLAEDSDKFGIKKALKSGEVDVLTLAPIHLPDEGIEKFVQLALDNNPKMRVTIQEFWLPFDIYDKTFTQRPKNVDHNAPTAAELRKLHEEYFHTMDEHVRELNKKLGKQAVFVVPVGQAVIALREKIIDGKGGKLKKQSDLFTDPIGHATAPLQALVAYCHYGVIYRKSPVGTAAPAILVKTGNAELAPLLQEIAWQAVLAHPLSGIGAAKK